MDKIDRKLNRERFLLKSDDGSDTLINLHETYLKLNDTEIAARNDSVAKLMLKIWNN